MPTINILDKDAQNLFEKPPQFTLSEQEYYFAIPEELAALTSKIATPSYLIGFILLFGYAKHSGKFYGSDTFNIEDIHYLCNRLQISKNKINFKNYALRTYNYHRQIICNHLNIKPFDKNSVELLAYNIRNRIARNISPADILYEVAYDFKTQKIEVPSYSRFVAVISKELSHFEIELCNVIKINITHEQKYEFERLVTSDTGNYILTTLKIIDHERTPAVIQDGVKNFLIIQACYNITVPLIKILNLHIDTVKHYATWVRKASIFQVLQLKSNKRYLYLLCFIQHQYYYRQDISADILLLSVKSAQNTANREQMQIAHQQVKLNNQTIFTLSNSRLSYKELVKKIESIVNLASMSDTAKLNKIDELLQEYHSQNPNVDVDELKIEQNIKELSKHDYYLSVENISLKLQNRVSQIMKYLQFEENSTKIFKAIKHYQLKEGNVTKSAPTNFLPEAVENLFSSDEKFRVSLYKALLYFYTADALKAGIINLSPAYRYLSLENYLIRKDVWDIDKDKLIEQAQLTEFKDVLIVLGKLKPELNEQYKTTNNNIISGANTYVKFDTKMRPIINTPKVEKIETKATSSLFAECKYVPILKILKDIQQVADYLSCFKHHSVKDKQILPDDNIFYAAILGIGCNIGINKIASVSKGISEDVLINFVNWHFSLDNIQQVNMKILALMEKLAITHIKQDPGFIHTSSDGRKIISAVESLNANTSFKYFGKGFGVVNYSFIDNKNRSTYATSISSAEREGAYVIDGVLHNPDIQSDVHSTDTHGYSEVIFAVMYLLGIFFAPRIKGLKKATLYGFYARKIYESQGFKITPDRYINEDLIAKEWDNIMRLIATIKLGHCTASQVFKRFSSYSKQNPLYCALKEFGRIIKTMFILKYIDDVELRQSIEKQLNRIELSNKFAKAISFDNNHEMLYSSKEEQDIAVNCQRLIQNCIVLWNELFLSQKLMATDDLIVRAQILEILSNGSTQVWDYINFSGEYDFSVVNYSKSEFDLEKILSFVL